MQPQNLHQHRFEEQPGLRTAPVHAACPRAKVEITRFSIICQCSVIFVLSVAKILSTRSIVKKKRRKPQISQDKAVATNYHSRQTSGKNQNREFFDVFFGPPSPRLWRDKDGLS
jgi:hypothetical protein